MADPAGPQTPADEDARRSERMLAAVNYVLMIIGISNGLTVLVAAIIAFVRRDTAEPWLRSHYQFQIATFWYGLFILLVGALTIWVFGLGLLIWFLGSVWLVVRAAVGLVRLADGRAQTDPTTPLV